MVGLDFALTVLSKLPRSLREAIMPDMLIPPIANNPDKVQLSRISHVYFEHPDLQKFRKFANDFGFIEAQAEQDCIYLRGYGIDPFVYVASQAKDNKPRFRGPAFVAASEEEFDKATKLQGASAPKLIQGPGGGKIITFSRPDNVLFHVVYGQEERKTLEKEPSATHEEQDDFNGPFNKPRQG